jgi:N-acetylmuramoyl-L-alanine amidase
MPENMVIISSGHGKYVRGATGYIDEVDEARKVVERVADYLREVDVIVTTYHDNVSKSQDENLKRIVDFHNSQTRGLDISVHFNDSNGEEEKPIGTECWYLTQAALAERIASAISSVSGLKDRGSKLSDSLYFLNNTEAPAILIEVAFVNSRTDTDLYLEHFEQICRSIAETISGDHIPEPAPPELDAPVVTITVTADAPVKIKLVDDT